MTGVQGVGPGRRGRRRTPVTDCQTARAETWEDAGSGRMNENRLSASLMPLQTRTFLRMFPLRL